MHLPHKGCLHKRATMIFLAALMLGACTLDPTTAEDHECIDDSNCKSGQTCVQGYCEGEVQTDDDRDTGDDDTGDDDTDDDDAGDVDTGAEDAPADTPEDIPDVPEDTSPPDRDLDGVPDETDNCPDVFNPSQQPSEGNDFGAACDPCYALTEEADVYRLRENRHDFVRSEGRSVMGALRRPQGVAVDPLGRVWVTEVGLNRVSMFHADGSLLRTIRQSESVPLRAPWGVAYNPTTDFVYVTNAASPTVMRFDGMGALESMAIELTGAVEPVLAGIAVDSAGAVYVVDRANHRVVSIDLDGNEDGERTFGSHGSALGSFDDPLDIAVLDDDSFLVVDNGNGRIQLCSLGACVLWAGSALTNMPISIATFGSGVDQMVLVGSVDNSVTLFEIDGTFVGQLDDSLNTIAWPAALGATTDGAPLVASHLTHMVHRFDGATLTYTDSLGDVAFAAGALAYPVGIDRTQAGDVLVVDATQSMVHHLEVDSGEPLGSFGGAGADNGQFLTPVDVVVDTESSQDFVYVTDSRSVSVFRLTNTGSAIFQNRFGEEGEDPLERATGIALHGDPPQIYVSDSGNQRVQVYASDGTYLRSLGRQGPYGGPGVLLEPWGLDFDSSGRLHVVDRRQGFVHVLERESGEALAVYGHRGDGELAEPTFVAIDARDRAFVADASLNVVRVFGLRGLLLHTIEAAPALPGSLDAPHGLEITSDPESVEFRLLVASSGGSRIDGYHVDIADDDLDMGCNEADPCPLDPTDDLSDDDDVCGPADLCPLSREVGEDGDDYDGDGIGDFCEVGFAMDRFNDFDGDGVGDGDNCPVVANMNQLDGDGDGVGDECNPCVVEGELVLNAHTFAEPIGVSPSGLREPRGVDVDIDENVYVADHNNGRVMVYAANGEQLAPFTHPDLVFPTGVAIERDATDQTLFVSDPIFNEVYRFNLSDGTFIGKVGIGSGMGQGELSGPSGMLAYKDSQDASSRLYVAEEVNNRISVFDVDTNTFSHHIQLGADITPRQIAARKIATNTTLYVAVTERDDNGGMVDQILEMDPNGGEQTPFYTPEDGRFVRGIEIRDVPAAGDDSFVILTSAGAPGTDLLELFVVESDESPIDVLTMLFGTYSFDGELFSSDSLGYHFSVDPLQHSVYVTDVLRGHVARLNFTVEGDAVREDWAPPSRAPAGELHAPRDVAWKDGLLYVADSLNGRVAVFDANGVPDAAREIFPEGESFLSFIPVSLEFDSAGSLHVLDVAEGGVRIFDEFGAETQVYGNTGGDMLVDPKWITGDGARMYVLDGLGGVFNPGDGEVYGVLRVYTNAGTLSTSSAEDLLLRPEAVAVGPDGRVYVTLLDGRIIVLDAALGILDTWETMSPELAGVHVTPEGAVFVVHRFGNQVLALNPEDGTILDRYGRFGVGPEEFHFSLGITGQGSTLYVTDANNNRVHQITYQLNDLNGNGNCDLLEQ